jgi:hypothetical protein
LSRILKTNEMSRYHDILKIYSNRYGVLHMEDVEVFFNQHKLFKETRARMLSYFNKGMMNSYDYATFSNVQTDIMIDLYFKEWMRSIRGNKNNEIKRPYNISGLNFVNTGKKVLVKGVTYDFLSMVDLSTRKGRNIYKEFFPLWFKNIQELAEAGFENIDFTNSGLSNEDIEDVREMVKFFKTNENDFIGGYQVLYNNGAYLSHDSANLNDKEKRDLQESFNKLPKKLQEMFFHYELIKNKFQYRVGGSYDIIPPKMYNKFSNWMNDGLFYEQLDKIYDLKKEEFFNIFIDSYVSYRSALPYIPSDEKLALLKTDEIRNLKTTYKDKEDLYTGDKHYRFVAPKVGQSTKVINDFILRVTYEIDKDMKHANSISQVNGYGGIDLISLFENKPFNKIMTYHYVLRNISIEDQAVLYQASLNMQPSDAPVSIIMTTTRSAEYDSEKYYVTPLGTIVKVTPANKTGFSWKVTVDAKYATIKEAEIKNMNAELLESTDDIRQAKFEMEHSDSAKATPRQLRTINDFQIVSQQYRNGNNAPVFGMLTNSMMYANSDTSKLLMGWGKGAVSGIMKNAINGKVFFTPSGFAIIPLSVAKGNIIKTKEEDIFTYNKREYSHFYKRNNDAYDLGNDKRFDANLLKFKDGTNLSDEVFAIFDKNNGLSFDLKKEQYQNMWNRYADENPEVFKDLKAKVDNKNVKGVFNTRNERRGGIHAEAIATVLNEKFSNGGVDAYTIEQIKDNIRNFFKTASLDQETNYIFVKNSNSNNISRIVEDGKIKILTESEFAALVASVQKEFSNLKNVFFTPDIALMINIENIGEIPC